jgi:dihydrolipoamide dehydrogenase
MDIPAVLARRDDVVGHLSDGSHCRRLERNGATLLRGHGRLTGERSVQVTAADGSVRELTARRAVILAPGSRASMLPVDGLVEAKPWTNREATLVQEVPARLLVFGGGVIGVELAQAIAALGSRVTIIEPGDFLLAREEPEAAQLVHASLERMGVTIHLGHEATHVVRLPDGTVRVTLADDAGTLEADELLVAVGRQGNVEELGLETVGVTPSDQGTVPVCDYMHVEGLPWLYVVGDANGRAQLTHAAAYQARVAARNALGLETHCVSDEVGAPRVVYTEPHVAAVGHTLATALEAGLDVRCFDRDPQRLPGASFVGRGTEGFARIIVDVDTRCVVGATFVAPDIAELLHAATIAIVGEVPIERLRHCVPAFPTRSEIWTRFMQLVDTDPAFAEG